MKMKTKSSLLTGIFTLGMIFGTFTLVIGIVRAGSPTFTVTPSGGDDTANIQKAFNDAIAAGPRSTVQLTPGQFYTNAIVAENFYGKFRGAGKDLTKIDVPRGLDPGAPGVNGPYGPHLFTFIGGDVCISDLGFEITPEKPAAPFEDPEEPSYDLLSIILITGEINSRIENIKCVGHAGTFPPFPYIKTFNVRLGIECNFGTGKHIITQCDFDSLWGGISAYVLLNAEMKMKSNSFKGGTFGIVNMDNLNSKFEISRNYIHTEFLYGIWVWQAGIIVPPSLSQWLITHNTLKVSFSADGMGLLDDLPDKTLEAVVSHNKIVLDNTDWGGIYTVGLHNAFISNNIIRGTGAYGIECDYSYNNLILGNNVQNVDARWFPIILYKAKDCVIVGGSTKTKVADFMGTNNLIVGMNNMQGNPPGPEIKEAMEQKRELLQSFPKF